MANRITFSLNPKKFLDKETYDPDDDGVISIANTEADMCKSVYDKNDNGVIGLAVVVASDDLLASDDTEESTNSNSPTKLKEFKISLGRGVAKVESLRISFDLRCYWYQCDSGDRCRARIYKNGNPVGTERAVCGTSYQTFVEDIEDWSDGDYIQLYVWNDGGNPTYVRNFRIYGKIINSVSETITLTKTA